MKTIKRIFYGALLVLGLISTLQAAPNWPNTVSSDALLLTAVNNCGTLLTSAVSSVATTISVANTSCFPTSGYFTIDEEAIKYTGKTGTTFTGCTRGSDGTSAVSHVNGSDVSQYVIAAYHNLLKAELIAMSTYFFQGSQVHIDTSSVRLAIGNAAPVSTLDVEGNASFGASYAGTTAAPSNGVIIQGKTGIGTSAPGSMLDVYGTGTTYVLSASSSTTGAPVALGVTNAGNVTMSGGLTVTGAVAGASGAFSGAVSGTGASFSSVTDSGLTSGRVTYATTAGLLTDSSAFTFNGSSVSVPAVVTSSFTMATNAGSGKYLISDASGNGSWTSAVSLTGSGTSGQVAYFNGASSLTSGSGLTYDGTTFYAGNINGTFLGLGRNRLINGDMQIDQRNAGAQVTISATAESYTVDRWYAQGESADGVFKVNRQTSVLPTGFVDAIISTVTTADASIGASQDYGIGQKIEGLNAADLMWGSANAKTVTISFWVRSSTTGTFGGSLRNSARNRSYPFTYAISAANTWEQKAVTVAGDTSGTWLTTNGIGVDLNFDMGSGTSQRGTAGAWAGSNYFGASSAVSLISTANAVWYLTGVQFEIGSSSTSYEYRDFGSSLRQCQRYYEKSYDLATVPGTSTSTGVTSFMITGAFGGGYGSTRPFKIQKRSTPTTTVYSQTGASGNVRNIVGAADVAATLPTPSENMTGDVSKNSGDWAASTPHTFHWTADSEL
jgi:hypothetical protein